jgi:hypothetical protein
MAIHLFCFEDEEEQWESWRTGFFGPLVQAVPEVVRMDGVFLLLARRVSVKHYWGYPLDQPAFEGYPVALEVVGAKYELNPNGNWKERNQGEFLVVPWPEGAPQQAFGPHMIVADVRGSDGSQGEWRMIQRLASAAAYPWDMVWSATAHEVPYETYGLGLPKFWSAGHAPDAWKPLVTFAATRLAARLTAQADREFYYTEYPPALTPDVYNAITTRQWNLPVSWDVVSDWQGVANALPPGVTGHGRLFVLQNFEVPTQDTGAVGAYLRFLNGEIFAIPGQDLVRDRDNLNEDALWLLMVRFCQALAEGRFAEFRSYYIALRTLVPNLSNQWLQPIAELRPETRPVHTNLNPTRLAQLYDPVLHMTLAQIWQDWSQPRGTAPAIP